MKKFQKIVLKNKKKAKFQQIENYRKNDEKFRKKQAKIEELKIYHEYFIFLNSNCKKTGLFQKQKNEKLQKISKEKL